MPSYDISYTVLQGFNWFFSYKKLWKTFLKNIQEIVEKS